MGASWEELTMRGLGERVAGGRGHGGGVALSGHLYIRLCSQYPPEPGLAASRPSPWLFTSPVAQVSHPIT